MPDEVHLGDQRTTSLAGWTSLGSRRLAALAAPADHRRACGLSAVPGASAGKQNTPSHNTPNEAKQRQSPTAVPLSTASLRPSLHASRAPDGVTGVIGYADP
jgi:hypothetical protein